MGKIWHRQLTSDAVEAWQLKNTIKSQGKIFKTVEKEACRTEIDY